MDTRFTVSSTRSSSLIRILVLTIALSLTTAGVAGAGTWHWSGWGTGPTTGCAVHSGAYWATGTVWRHNGDAWAAFYGRHARPGTNIKLNLRGKALAWNSYGYGHISIPWNYWPSPAVKHDCGALACKYIGCQVGIWN
jgi:hypothetical protein